MNSKGCQFYLFITSVFSLGFYFLEGSDICNLINDDFIDYDNKLLLVFSFTMQQLTILFIN